MKRSLRPALLLPALLAGVVAAVSVSASLAAPGGDRPAVRKPTRPVPATPAGPPRADRDRDRVFDDLRARADRASAGTTLPVIVRLDGPPTEARLRALERAIGAFPVGRRLRLLDGFSTRLTRRQIDALAARPGVASLEEDGIVRASNASAQEAFGVTKARADLPALDGDADGDPARYGPGDLVAAVVDTGIDAGHQDLDGGKVIAFRDFVAGRAAAYDDNGHGTHVAGTVAGDGGGRADRLHRGVAPDAALVGVKVLDAAGEGSMSNVVAALDWLVANRAALGLDVVNLSLGAAGCSDGTDATSAAVDRANSAGLLVVVAAGNEGPGRCTIGSPGAARGALTVGAMADTGADGFHQAYFSSRGTTLDGRVKPDVSAPGVGITSAQHGTSAGYVAMNGTSMATPFVAGVALLMRDATPGLSPERVKAAVRDTAEDWGRGGDNRAAGSFGADVDYGAGRLDAYAALRAAGAALTAPPPAPTHLLREGSMAGSGDAAEFPVEVTDTRFPLAATLVIADLTTATSTTTDFDLEVLDPTGREVAASRYTTRQEEVGFRPTTTGTYTIRVESYAGAGSFFVDVAGGVSRSVPSPGPDPTPDPTPTPDPDPSPSPDPDSSPTPYPDPSPSPSPSPDPSPTPDPTPTPSPSPAPSPTPDPSPSPSPNPAPAASPTPAPAPAPPGPAPSPAPTPDRSAPRVTLTVPTQSLATLRRKGYVRVTVTCTERCRLTATLRLDGRTAKRLRLSSGKAATIATASTSLKVGRPTTVLVRLARTARARLPRATSLTASLVLRATDAAGNTRETTRKTTFRR